MSSHESASQEYAVLIVGGMSTYARVLAGYLLGESSDGTENGAIKGLALVKFVRIVDKFSVDPPTTYLDPDFKRCLARTDVFEYKQINLGVESKIGEALVPPPATGREAFDIVFDLSGETTFDRPEIIHAQNTYTQPLSFARQASRLPHPPKAYIRLTSPYNEMRSSHPITGYTETFSDVSALASSSSPTRAEELRSRQRTFSFGRDKDKSKGDDPGMRPDGVRGRWWHEAMRGLGGIGQREGESPLNLVVVRVGEGYGRGLIQGSVLARLIIGHLYQFEKEEMKFLHNPDLRINTIHAFDVARGLLAAAEWIIRIGGRSTADELAGVVVPSSSCWPGAITAANAKTAADLPVPLDPAVVVRLPLFNLVDEANSTQESVGRAIAKVFSIKHSFYGDTLTNLVQKFAKFDFNDMVQDVNEKHMEIWQDMLENSKPPISDTPLSPFLDDHAFRKMAVNLDGTKFRKVVGFKCVKPRLDPSDLAAMLSSFQADKIWPTL